MKNINFKNFFTKKKDFLTLGELNNKVHIKNINSLDEKAKIFNVKTLMDSTKHDATFLSNDKYIYQLQDTKAGFCFITEKLANKLDQNNNTKVLIVDNPHYAYTVLLNELYSVPLFEIENGISEKAIISKTTKIGNNVEIQAGVFIDENVVIGDNCKICANTVINHNCIIGNNNYIGANSTISYTLMGNNNIIQNNSSLGHCGFGFAHNQEFNYKIPQLGLVKIGNFVEIGAGCSIARGAFDDTEINDKAKIDCLTHIGHGVKIGDGSFLAAQCGVSGSTKIGMFCQIGGQAGFAGHLQIGNFNEIAGKSGVIKDTNDNEQLGGYPAINLIDWHKQTILLKKLLKNKNKL